MIMRKVKLISLIATVSVMMFSMIFTIFILVRPYIFGDFHPIPLMRAVWAVEIKEDSFSEVNTVYGEIVYFMKNENFEDFILFLENHGDNVEYNGNNLKFRKGNSTYAVSITNHFNRYVIVDGLTNLALSLE